MPGPVVNSSCTRTATAKRLQRASSPTSEEDMLKRMCCKVQEYRWANISPSSATPGEYFTSAIAYDMRLGLIDDILAAESGDRVHYSIFAKSPSSKSWGYACKEGIQRPGERPGARDMTVPVDIPLLVPRPRHIASCNQCGLSRSLTNLNS